MKMDDGLNVQSAQSLFTLCSNKTGVACRRQKGTVALILTEANQKCYAEMIQTRERERERGKQSQTEM